MRVEQYEAESYIEHFSKHNGPVVDEALLDRQGRLVKAAKVRAVLTDFLERPLSELDCLDLGCSTGHITNALAPDFRAIIGIETDAKALELAQAEHAADFHRGSALRLPYADETFDAVLCNHVYEHVHDQRALFDETWRVLRPGGVCYLAAGNRLKVIEPHYRLPFLSWLPKPLAHRYLRLAGKGDYYFEQHLTCWGLRRLAARFEVHDYTMRVLTEPRVFADGDPLLARVPSRGLPRPLLRLGFFLLPTFIWILRKP